MMQMFDASRLLTKQIWLTAVPVLIVIPAVFMLIVRTNLRAYSIWNAEDTINKLTMLPDNPPGQIACRVRSCYIPLSRPGGGATVAIFQYSNYGPDRSGELNPRGMEKANFDYGPIPLLQNMSPDQADQLWSICPTKSNATDRTYNLVNQKDGPRYPLYPLDLVFENNRLKKYRLRGVAPSQEWHQVHGA